MSETSSFRNFSPAVIWGIILVILSTIPGVDLPATKLIEPDKLAHAIAYGLFTLLILRGFWLQNGKKSVKWLPQVLLSFLIAAGLGFLMEWIQGRFFPYRTFDIGDEIANILGSVLSIGIFKLILKL